MGGNIPRDDNGLIILNDTNTPGKAAHAMATPYEVVSKKAIEPKTVAGVVGAGGGYAVSEFINYLIDVIAYNGDAAPEVPVAVSGFVSFVVTTAGAFVASYYTRHVQREE